MLDWRFCKTVHPGMRLVRNTLFFVVGTLLLSVVLFVIWAWFAEERALGLLQRAVAFSTPYDLELRNPSLSWSPFRFRADLVLLQQRDVVGPPLISVQQADLEMPLIELLTGNIGSGNFHARNVSYYIDDSQSDEPLDLEGLLSPLSRVPAQLSVDSVHLISKAADLSIIPVSNLSARRTDTGTLEAIASALIGQRSLVLETRADWRTLPDGSHRLDLLSAVHGRDGQSDLRLNGVIDAQGPSLNYRFELDGFYRDVSDFVQVFATDAYPFSGNLEVQGSVQGSLDSYELLVDQLQLTTEDAYRVQASGLLRASSGSPVALELEASGDAQRLEAALPLPEIAKRVLTRSELRLSLGGTLEAPRVESARVVLFGAGDTQLEFTGTTLDFTLEDLREQRFEASQRLQFRLASKDLAALLDSADIRLPFREPVAAEISGVVDGSPQLANFAVDYLAVVHPHYQLGGSLQARWADDLLSAPRVDLRLEERHGDGWLSASGTVADLGQQMGVALNLAARDLDLGALAVRAGTSLPFPLTLANANTLLLRAAEPLQLRDLLLELEPLPGLRLAASGHGRLMGGAPEADLQITLRDSSAADASPLPFASRLGNTSGQLRLRPTYATLLADAHIGATDMQSVLGLTLEKGAVRELALDLYSPHLHLEDFALRATPPGSSNDDEDPPRATAAVWRARIPGFPMHLTLRSQRVSGPLSKLENLSIAIEESERGFQLTHFDARYAGGNMTLRGALDLDGETIAASIAGQGLRIPLADVTQDLGLQKSVTGSLSVRGGLSTQFAADQDWIDQLRGGLSLAVSDTTVSGAAYDLLMSNILAWVVSGANEKTTTFSCAMASFAIENGVARSRDLFIDTPRMLAQGKATFDLPRDTLDIRLEPRSKSRLFQFPSAVNIEGAIGDPAVRVSALQATADLSTQALLLLPSLTLKLFGIGAGSDVAAPCMLAQD